MPSATNVATATVTAHCQPPTAQPRAAHTSSSAAKLTATVRGVLTPATREPNPPGRAHGMDGIVATMIAARATDGPSITSSPTRHHDPAPSAPAVPVSELSAPRSTSRVSTRAMTPIGPMSDCFMISKARAASRREPSPSAVSATPSRWKPPVAPVSHTSARIAASHDPAPIASTPPAMSPPTTPRHSPSQGKARMARVATRRSTSAIMGAGRMVNSEVAAARPPSGPRAEVVLGAPSWESVGVPIMPTCAGCPPRTSTPRRRHRRRRH